MAKITPIRVTEQFQYFLEDLKESFWGEQLLAFQRSLGESQAAWEGLLEKVRKGDYDAVKAAARAIYPAPNHSEARDAFHRFQKRWRPHFPDMLRQFERDLPELLSFFSFPKHLWRQLRTANVIERVFVEVQRRTRPMLCFVNVASVDRIIYSRSFTDSTWNGATALSRFLHKPLDITRTRLPLANSTRVCYIRPGWPIAVLGRCGRTRNLFGRALAQPGGLW